MPVVTYGHTDDFPAFYSPKSRFKVGAYTPLRITQLTDFLTHQSPWTVNNPTDAAKIISRRFCLRLHTTLTDLGAL